MTNTFKAFLIVILAIVAVLLAQGFKDKLVKLTQGTMTKIERVER
jgi:hypothetical protein